MARAEHIFVKRHGYTHHGIDTGEGTVIHYAAKPGKIIETPIESFAKGSPIQVRDYSICYSPDVVMDRAKSRIGEARYSLISNNCEHFATWCKTGLGTSQQVHRAGASTAGIGGSGLASAAGLAVVSATGAAAGLSGSGIISGLATIGGVVGGGAVTGIVAVGAGPALISVGAMKHMLKDDRTLDDTERDARRIGRATTSIGAAAGTIASVGAVAANGAVNSLGAPGITSGLAAVGATVGGGMAAGVLVVAAVPAAAAAAIGYGSYRCWRSFKRSSCFTRSLGSQPAG